MSGSPRTQTATSDAATPDTTRRRRSGVRPADLVELTEQRGPFATLWLGRRAGGAWGSETDRTSTTSASSASSALDVLAAAGAPDAAVQQIGLALARVDADADGVVLAASAERLVLVAPLPEAPRSDLALWASLPALAPVIEHRQADVPAVIVLADEAGADVVVTAPDRSAASGGYHDPVEAGWPERRRLDGAARAAAQHAEAVAAEIAALAGTPELTDGGTPPLIVLGGEAGAVTSIHATLPAGLRATAHVFTPARAIGGSDDAGRRRELGRLLRSAVAEETVTLLDALRSGEAHAGHVANGAAGTLAALDRGDVDVLLVHDDPADTRLGWFSPRSGAAALDPDALDDAAAPARLVDVAIHAGLRRDAEVRVVPDAASLEDGLAAILR